MEGAEPGEEVVEAVGCVIGEADFVVEVGAAGGHGEDFYFGFDEAEGFDYVLADAEGGCCCETHDWDVGEVFAEPV